LAGPVTGSDGRRRPDGKPGEGEVWRLLQAAPTRLFSSRGRYGRNRAMTARDQFAHQSGPDPRGIIGPASAWPTGRRKTGIAASCLSSKPQI